MGACIGKKSKKYQTNHVKVPEIKIQDDNNVEKKSISSITPKISLPQDDSPIIDSDDIQLRDSAIEQISINSEVQSIIDQQNRINETLRIPFTNRVISTTDTEFELELANLAFEQMNNSPNIPIENENSNNTK